MEGPDYLACLRPFELLWDAAGENGREAPAVQMRVQAQWALLVNKPVSLAIKKQVLEKATALGISLADHHLDRSLELADLALEKEAGAGGNAPAWRNEVGRPPVYLENLPVSVHEAHPFSLCELCPEPHYAQNNTTHHTHTTQHKLCVTNAGHSP